jgi:hypothetical protein
MLKIQEEDNSQFRSFDIASIQKESEMNADMDYGTIIQERPVRQRPMTAPRHRIDRLFENRTMMTST